MKKETKETKETLVFLGIVIVVLFLSMIRVIFSPVIIIIRKIKETIAMLGITLEQRELLKQLSKQRMPFLQTVARIFSEDENYSQANMMSRALGTEVLKQQVKSEKKEKNEIEKLIDKCRKAGISEWRIDTVL